MNASVTAALVHELLGVQRALRRIDTASLRGEGLGVALHFLLRCIGEGECRATQLAGRLGVSAPVLSRQIAELEEQGLLARKKDPSDGRAHLLALTPAGKDKLMHVQTQRSALFQECLGEWSESDAANAARALRQLTESLMKPA
ncbi:MarR family winged helix-turn-helix transcriptional regulator [Arthrobacter sp. B6]|uniref:MarR family winged helix-turn-helix transcriptional regulator n=1 Tax=Arthrobacter sp. B6 TaxID=1570137 RepID=UPI002F91B4F3